jgi:hypothetical protein
VSLAPAPVANASRGRVHDRWSNLKPFSHVIEASDQVLLVASTGGAKSTLVATLTLPVSSLVALDEKGALRLPRSRLVELPSYDATVTKAEPGAYLAHVRKAIAYRTNGDPNRIVLRPHDLDVDDFDAHDDIFHAVHERRGSILWIDEISATGASAQRSQRWLRALSARGRTRPVGLWTCTQAPYGMTPPILRRNATYTIFGPLDPDDIAGINRPGIEIAETLPPKTGRFIVYAAGEREPMRLYVPIPDQLKGWRAP